MPCDTLQCYCITNYRTYNNIGEIVDENLFKQYFLRECILFFQSGSSLNATFTSLHFMQLYYVYTVLMNLIDLNEILNETSYQR